MFKRESILTMRYLLDSRSLLEYITNLNTIQNRELRKIIVDNIKLHFVSK